jgi:hypothetical protein
MAEEAWPRERHPDLRQALEEAVRHFRGVALSYRSQHHPNKQRLDKSVRRSLAASNENFARVIERHLASLQTPAHPNPKESP